MNNADLDRWADDGGAAPPEPETPPDFAYPPPPYNWAAASLLRWEDAERIFKEPS